MSTMDPVGPVDRREEITKVREPGLKQREVLTEDVDAAATRFVSAICLGRIPVWGT